MPWHVYIVRCADTSLYCGITTCLDRRVFEHNSTKKGAKYTKARRPVVLVWSDNFKSRSHASKAEYRIKKLAKANKENLVKSNLNFFDFFAS